MKSTVKIALMAVFFGLSTSGYAEFISAPNQAQIKTAQQSQKTAEELQALGKYLSDGVWNLAAGYKRPPRSEDLTNISASVNETVLAFIASLPIAKLSKNISFLYNNSALTQYLNTAFEDYNDPTTLSLNVGVNEIKAIKNLDQPPYMTTPANQAVQNILSMPPNLLNLSSAKTNTDLLKAVNANYCIKSKDDDSNSAGCPVSPIWYMMYGGGIALSTNADNQSTDDYPGLQDISNGTFNQKIVPSLSFDSLMAPVLLTDTPIQDDNSSDNTKNATLGFYGSSQVGQADAFIRYVAGMMIPLAKPDPKTYNDLVTTLSDPSAKPEVKAQNLAQLNAYSVMLRTYAAQTSVGMSNLYYLLGKRVANKNLNGNSTSKSAENSEASLEFNMATHRLFDPGSPMGATGSGDGNQPSKWLAEIQKASSTDVSKQSAILLAEMNYQLYLNRMTMERLLATMSVMQLQQLSTIKSSVNLQQAANTLSASNNTQAAASLGNAAQ